MAKVTIDKFSYGELVELQSRVAEAIEAKRSEEASALRAQIEATINDAGFSVDDIFGGLGKRGRKSAQAIVKYRNPKDPTQTWSGRGRKPKWLVEAEAKGASLDKFAA